LDHNNLLIAQENAESYFQKAKNFDRKLLKRKQRAKEIQAQLKNLLRLNENLQSIDSYKELEKIELKLKSENLLQKSEVEAAKLRLPYKKFIYKEWEIWVGKSARDNDMMTFKYAQKEDWWLHVQGYSGSHVVIRNPKRKEDIPQNVLQHAARLSITNSEAKHARYVPVVYSKVKYVRKPRKSAPGTVLPIQTKTIYTDPL
jgi:predicted ribosome quality control (RQC) complex YloA/Tae2 family protein